MKKQKKIVYDCLKINLKRFETFALARQFKSDFVSPFYVTVEVLKRCHILIFTRPHTLPSNKSVAARCDFIPEPNAPLTRLLSTN